MVLPKYITPENFLCPACNEPCHIIALNNAYDYSGTHCTHGKVGTYYPFNYGKPVTDCCEVEVDAEVIFDNFSIDNCNYYKNY